MKGAMHFALPRQRVHQLMELDRDLQLAERLTLLVQQLQIRHETQRVGHRDDAFLQLYPVPGYPSRLGVA